MYSLPASPKALQMAVKPMTRTFATRFYDSPLYQALRKEYESASETEEKGLFFHFPSLLDVTASLEKLTKQFNKMYHLGFL